MPVQQMVPVQPSQKIITFGGMAAPTPLLKSTQF